MPMRFPLRLPALLPALLATVLLAPLLWLAAPVQAMGFRVNAIGYHPQAPKWLILEDVPEGTPPKLALFDPEKKGFGFKRGKVMYEIVTVKPFQDKQRQAPGAVNWLVDFSAFREPGSYDLLIDGAPAGAPKIKISEFNYWDTLKTVTRGFFLQRSGVEVVDPVTGMNRRAGHTEDGWLVDEASGELQFKDVVGGWYDGPGYDKTVLSAALSTGLLQSAYQGSPKPYDFLLLDYPATEPGLGEVPDYLHEVQWGLDWLMAMQRLDGAVYGGVSGRQAAGGKTRPDNDTQERLIAPATPRDTAAAAASLAMASRTFRKRNLGFAVKSLMAAERAWKTLPAAAAKPDAPYIAWAAAELYVSTGKPEYHRAFLAHLKTVPVEPVSLQNPALLGLADYVFQAPAKDAQAEAAIRKAVLKAADTYASRIDASPWGIALNRFMGDANPRMLSQAALLMNAHRMSNNTRYLKAATRPLDYVMGVNPLGLGFVTGLGEHSVKHPAHALVDSTGVLIPGLVVGGAHELAADGRTPAGYGMLSYADDAGAVAANAPSLANGAVLVYLLGLLNAAYNAAP